MYEVKILDEVKKIAYLKWEGTVKVAEVKECNKQMEEICELFKNEKFYLVVDVRELKVFSSETKELIIEQQKQFVPKIYEVAEVVNGIITKNQMEETKKKANNNITKTYNSLDDAVKHLRKVSVY